MKARRFLNVVTERCGFILNPTKSLSRILDPTKHLFYPSISMADQAQQHQAGTTDYYDDDDLWLPTPSLTFNSSPSPGYCDITSLDILPLYGGARWGGGEERLLGVDGDGKTVLYNADTGSAEIMPRLNEPKGYFPIYVCAPHPNPTRPDALYVMDRGSCSFDSLVYGDPNLPLPCDSMNPTMDMDTDRCMWQWRPLPPPPIVVDDSCSIFAQSYALLHGHGHGGESSSTICVSFSIQSQSQSHRHRDPIGITYCFDTATHEWTKAGDWMLPFWTRGLHVPELGDNLLFGFENAGSYLHPCRFCAVDVSGAVRMDGSAPALRHAWVDINPPSRWHEDELNVVYLGDGRFCIHKKFDIMETDGWGSGQDCVDTVDILTGVEVVRQGPNSLRMIKHRTRRLDSWISSVL